MVTVNFEDDEISELYKLLDENRPHHKKLLKKVHQAITGELLRRIDLRIAKEKGVG